MYNSFIQIHSDLVMVSHLYHVLSCSSVGVGYHQQCVWRLTNRIQNSQRLGYSNAHSGLGGARWCAGGSVSSRRYISRQGMRGGFGFSTMASLTCVTVESSYLTIVISFYYHRHTIVNLSHSSIKILSSFCPQSGNFSLSETKNKIASLLLNYTIPRRQQYSITQMQIYTFRESNNSCVMCFDKTFCHNRLEFQYLHLIKKGRIPQNEKV